MDNFIKSYFIVIVWERWCSSGFEWKIESCFDDFDFDVLDRDKDHFLKWRWLKVSVKEHMYLTSFFFFYQAEYKWKFISLLSVGNNK